MAEVLCIGDSCADLIVSSERSGEMIRCGGAAANSAAALGRLDVSVALCAKAGSDIYGKKMKEELERSGADASHLILDDSLDSTLIRITVDENGDRHPVLLNADDPSYLKICRDDLDRIDLSDTGYILTNGMMLFREPCASSILAFLKKAHEKGITVVLDINFRPETRDQDRAILMQVIEVSDILLGSVRDDYLTLCETNYLEEAVSKLKKEGRIIVAHDEKGSDVFCDGKRSHCDSFCVETADSIGAGDNFNAGFLYGLIHQKTLEECNILACAVAAYSLQKEGARYTPDEKQLFEFIREQKHLPL